MIPDGVHPTVHRDDYDKIDRTNFSWLKHFAKSPAHARHFKIEPPPDTDAKKLGRVVHLAAFEPERFRSRIAVWDGKVRNGKAWDDFEKANAGLEILTKNELAKCLAIQKAVQADAEAMKYVQGGRGEVSLCWTLHQQMTDGTTDAIACKGRMDFYARGALVDLKSTRDASREAFGRQAFGLNYHTQGAWFQDALAALGKAGDALRDRRGGERGAARGQGVASARRGARARPADVSALAERARVLPAHERVAGVRPGRGAAAAALGVPVRGRGRDSADAGREAAMNAALLMPSKYLKAAEFHGRDFTLTITRVVPRSSSARTRRRNRSA
jgi:hypothetical protein